MRDVLNFGVLAAVAGGAAFGLVTAIEGVLGRRVGPLNASLLEHIAAGAASILLLAIVLARGSFTAQTARTGLPLAALGGVVVVVAVVGIAYALPRIGVFAGNTAIVFGQMAIAVLIDTAGLVGYERIPLTWTRVLGLLLLAAGVYLVLPRAPQ